MQASIPLHDFKSLEKPYILAPYANRSEETSQEIVERNKFYARFLYGMCCARLTQQPIMPLLEYMDLPPYPYLPEEKFSGEEISKACGFYIGKQAPWRDYSSWTSEAKTLIVGVDYGISKGMQKVIDESKIPVILVTIRELGDVTTSEAVKDFFLNFPPMKEEEEVKNHIWDLINMCWVSTKTKE
jgi:hypothetical protein